MKFSNLSASVVAAVVLTFLVSCSDDREYARRVQLVLNSETLTPSATFELRFEDPIIEPGIVGRSAILSPLVIEPRLQGRFVWLSTRSGVFTPTESTALATAYHFALRRGLKDLAGHPLDARLGRTLRTPEFAVEHGWLGFSAANVPSNPEIKLNFNADVSPDVARSFLEFRSRSGQRIPARVLHATGEDSFYLNQWYPGDVMAPWRSLFATISNQLSVVSNQSDGMTSKTNPVLNRLIVSPLRPLPVGAGWKLVVAAGLPSAERALRLRSPLEIPLGDVVDFAVSGVAAHNARENGKRIGIRFSKELASELNSSNLLEWISVRPPPANLTVRRYPQSVELDGEFAPQQPYRVQVLAGLSAEDGMRLERDYTNTVEFTPLPPRLYFPEFTTQQLATGRREFELVAVNVPSARIRARQLDRHTLIHALRGYQSYFARGDDHQRNWNEPFREIDFNVVAGRSIFSKLLNTASTNTDESARVSLHWDELLGRGRHGALFVVAEQTPAGFHQRSKQGTQAIVQLTDLGLAWKTSDGAATVHVFSHATGRPVESAIVRLLTDENETLCEHATDAQGLVTLPLATNAIWLLAESGDDLHAERLRDHEVYLYNFGLRYDWNPGKKDRHEVFLFTDRPLYRPGETVHFKSILRDRDEDSLHIPAGAKAKLRVTDPKGEKVFDTNLVVSAAGSVAASLALPEGVRGHYALALSLGQNVYNHSVQVADFQPNAFAVTLDAKSSCAAGELPRIPVSASYLMGAPLTRAKIAWSLEAGDEGFYPNGFDEFLFTTEWVDSVPGRVRSSFTVHGEGLYSAKSNFVIAPQISFNPAAPQPRAVHLRAEVTDLNQQTITRGADFVVHSSEFYLGLGRFKNVLRAGEPLAVNLVAVGADGKPRNSPITAKLNLFRVDHFSIPMQGAGRTRRYRTEIVVTNVASAGMMTQSVRRSGEKWEVAPGQEPAPLLVPDQPGQWLLEARAQDAGGREVISIMQFYVSGRSENAWAYRNETQMDLVPDKAAYVPGMTANILVKAPFTGHALVTVEREKVLRSFIAELDGNAPSVEVPIQDSDAPNVFVSVLLLRGAADSPKQFKLPEHRIGYCEIKVPSSRGQLHVSIVPDAGDYRPGQAVSVTAEVTDNNGQPARETEVTLYAVDEGILGITGHETPDPYPFFFQPRSIAVHSAVSLPGLFPEDPGQHRFGNKGYLIGGGGSGRGRVRRNFMPCAYWNATLLTDAAGRVTAAFSAPDSLTRYRLMAVAHNARHQFGSGAAGFEVNKPLMIEPALPRFAHVTDNLVARAVVHNQTPAAGQIEVTLELDDKAAVRNSPERRLLHSITLAAKTSAPVEFPVEFTGVGSSKWIWRARFIEAADAVRPISSHSDRAQFTDAAESTILVEYLSPMIREIHLAHTEAAVMNLLSAANPQLLEGRGTVAVQVSNSRLGELAEALRYLLQYPYGCVEQTGSSLLPWIVLRNAPALTLDFKKSPEEFDKAIRAGVQRLLAMQTESGGLSYWPGARQPMFWGSAYGGFVLARAVREGHAVAPAKFGRLLKYLSTELRGISIGDRDAVDVSAACLAVYALALAGKAEPAYHEVLFNRRARLSSDNRALLALAIAECGGPAPMVAELLSSGAGAARSEMDWFACDSRDLALQLLAWTRHSPQDQKIDTLVAELTHSRQHGHWQTTQGNAWAVFALKEYADRVEGQIGAAGGRLAWAAQSREFALPNRPETFAAVFPIAREAADAPLTLSNPARHRLYTQVTVEARSQLAQQPRQDRGFGISRRYQRVDDDGQLHDITNLHVGDRVLVSLSVDVHQPAHYLAIDDALPAVLEPLNSEFKSQETSQAIAAKGSSDLPWYNDHREFRADRALFFRDHVETAGRYQIQYLTRVRAAGTVAAPCAKVEEMYHPERFGLSETMALTALPLE